MSEIDDEDETGFKVIYARSTRYGIFYISTTFFFDDEIVCLPWPTLDFDRGVGPDGAR